jgi:hypothetical protein
MAKRKLPSMKDMALQELVDARTELQRIEQMFNFAEDAYFEIANMELTIAKMRYKLAVSKLRMICGQDEVNPQLDLFFSDSWHY